MFFENTNSPLQLNNNGVSLASILPNEQKLYFAASCPLADSNKDVYTLISNAYYKGIKYIGSSTISTVQSQDFSFSKGDISILTTGRNIGNMTLKGVPNDLLKDYALSLMFTQTSPFDLYKPSHIEDKDLSNISMEYSLSKDVSKVEYGFSVFVNDSRDTIDVNYNTRLYVDNTNSKFIADYCGNTEYNKIKVNDTIHDIVDITTLSNNYLWCKVDLSPIKTLLIKAWTIVDGVLIPTDGQYTIYDYNFTFDGMTNGTYDGHFYIKYRNPANLNNFLALKDYEPVISGGGQIEDAQLTDSQKIQKAIKDKTGLTSDPNFHLLTQASNKLYYKWEGINVDNFRIEDDGKVAVDVCVKLTIYEIQCIADSSSYAGYTTKNSVKSTTTNVCKAYIIKGDVLTGYDVIRATATPASSYTASYALTSVSFNKDLVHAGRFINSVPFTVPYPSFYEYMDDAPTNTLYIPELKTNDNEVVTLKPSAYSVPSFNSSTGGTPISYNILMASDIGMTP